MRWEMCHNFLTTDLPDIRSWQLRRCLAFNQDRFIGHRGCPTAFHLSRRSRWTWVFVYRRHRSIPPTWCRQNRSVNVTYWQKGQRLNPDRWAALRIIAIPTCW